MAKINETNYPRRQASEYAPTDMLIVQPVPDPEQEHSGDSRTTRVSDLKEYMLGDADPSKIGTPAAGTYTSVSNTNAQNIAALDHALGEKVDKISGKGLSTNDYTNAEKLKLATLENYDDTDLTDRVSDVEDSLTGKADKVTSATADNLAALDSNGNLTDSGKSKSATIPSGGTTGQVLKKKSGTNYDTEWATPTDTKNTAGSTDSSSKLFLIGATSQAANPQTYSQDTAYVGTDGNLYSGSKVVATQNMIGDAWVTSHAYAVGDYCIDGNVLYKCKTAHTSSASNRPPYTSYWDAVSVSSQLSSTETVLYDSGNITSSLWTDQSEYNRYIRTVSSTSSQRAKVRGYVGYGRLYVQLLFTTSAGGTSSIMLPVCLDNETLQSNPQGSIISNYAVNSNAVLGFQFVLNDQAGYVYITLSGSDRAVWSQYTYKFKLIGIN